MALYMELKWSNISHGILLLSRTYIYWIYVMYILSVLVANAVRITDPPYIRIFNKQTISTNISYRSCSFLALSSYIRIPFVMPSFLLFGLQGLYLFVRMYSAYEYVCIIHSHSHAHTHTHAHANAHAYIHMYTWMRYMYKVYVVFWYRYPTERNT